MVKIGIIGVGGIANNVHIPGIQKSKGGKVVAICDIDEKKLKAVGDRLGIPEELRFKDYRDLIDSDEVEAVEVCTPNYLHVPMAIEAVKAGKPVNVEKPLGLNHEESKKLGELIKEKNIKNMMSFSYRFKPAVRYAKEILDKGMLGKIVSVNVEYLQSGVFIKGRRLEWRFVKEYAGTGVLGDLGVHLIDMAQFLLGDIKRVCGRTGTVVKQRQKLDSDEYAEVKVDDYCNFMADFQDGVVGNFVTTKCAIGHSNTIKCDVYGDKGVLSFNLNNPGVLGVCIGEIDVESNGLHFVNVPSRYFVDQEQSFIDMIEDREVPYLPTIEDGLKCQKILDALLLSSEENRWVEL